MRKKINQARAKKSFVKNSSRVAGANLPSVRLKYRGGIRL